MAADMLANLVRELDDHDLSVLHTRNTQNGLVGVACVNPLHKKNSPPGRDASQVVCRQALSTIFRMSVYPMFKPMGCQPNDPIILPSDWSRALKLVMNIDENIFRMPIYPMYEYWWAEYFVLGQATPSVVNPLSYGPRLYTVFSSSGEVTCQPFHPVRGLGILFGVSHHKSYTVIVGGSMSPKAFHSMDCMKVCF